jgi:alcohol dehydrogenase
MRAVQFQEFQRQPTITNVADPSPPSDGAVIEVGASGLCRSDWHGWMGHDPTIVLPHVPGHEFAGTIVEVGTDVKRWKRGDRVTMPFVAACGHCEECAGGQQQVCRNQSQPGFTGWGSFAQYVAVDRADVNLVRLPEQLEFDIAASLGCRFATAFHALVDQASLKPGQWIAVHGCGGVGLSTVVIASQLGAKVIAIDISDEALVLAASLGADVTINASREPSVVRSVMETTGGGAHVSMDALGNPVLLSNSVRCLRRRGVHLQVGLMLEKDATPSVPMEKIVAHEISVLGCHGIQAHRYPDLLRLAVGNHALLSSMIGGRITLDAAPQALVGMGDFTGTGIKVITSFDA